MVEKKYIKMGVAGFAAAALIIGLSVGITQKNKNSKNMSASNANNMANMDADTYAHCTTSGKSGKSGGGSGSSGKSGKSGGSKGSSGKSGKSGGGDMSVPHGGYGRRLVVPGTEDYAASVGSGKRGKLRSDLQAGRGKISDV